MYTCPDCGKSFDENGVVYSPLGGELTNWKIFADKLADVVAMHQGVHEHTRMRYLAGIGAAVIISEFLQWAVK